MTIGEKVNKILETHKYNFCTADFTLYNTDQVRIYDKVDGVCLHTSRLGDELPEEFKNKEYKKEELIKVIQEMHTFAICFYLEAPDKIEGPISTGPKFI